ncbi:unnamed protein product, partial [Didymodactylos carnosus]
DNDNDNVETVYKDCSREKETQTEFETEKRDDMPKILVENFSRTISLSSSSNSKNGDHNSSNYSTINSSAFKSHESIFVHNSIDILTSDGWNILSYSKNSNILCYIPYQSQSEIMYDWRHSEVFDMCWSEQRKEFLCATEQSLYCVKLGHTIKIYECKTLLMNYICRISIDNAGYIWILSDQVMTIYSSSLKPMKTYYLKSFPQFNPKWTSFCISNNLIAIVFSRSKYDPFHVKFYDLDFNLLQKIFLKRFNSKEAEIRCDKNMNFFITTGKCRKLYVINYENYSRNVWFVKLKGDANSVAILDDGTAIIANGSNRLELVYD